MVTDIQYKALQKRVEELERKIDLLSKQYSSLYMKHDMQSFAIPASNTKRDTTKYYFNGYQYCKRQLVLACVKKYVEDHPGISGAELIECFPNYIQGSLGVIRKAEEAERYSNAVNRFYFGDYDILLLKDDTYVVCSQWDKNNINRFIALMRDLQYDIEERTKRYYF